MTHALTATSLLAIVLVAVLFAAYRRIGGLRRDNERLQIQLAAAQEELAQLDEPSSGLGITGEPATDITAFDNSIRFDAAALHVGQNTRNSTAVRTGKLAVTLNRLNSVCSHGNDPFRLGQAANASDNNWATL